MPVNDHSFPDGVESVIRAMRENVTLGLTLEDMADVACLSPFRFHRVFITLPTLLRRQVARLSRHATVP